MEEWYEGPRKNLGNLSLGRCALCTGASSPSFGAAPWGRPRAWSPKCRSSTWMRRRQWPTAYSSVMPIRSPGDRTQGRYFMGSWRRVDSEGRGTSAYVQSLRWGVGCQNDEHDIRHARRWPEGPFRRRTTGWDEILAQSAERRRHTRCRGCLTIRASRAQVRVRTQRKVWRHNDYSGRSRTCSNCEVMVEALLKHCFRPAWIGGASRLSAAMWSRKRGGGAMLGFKSFRCARALIAGIEMMHMIRKGQMKCLEGEASSAARKFYSLARWATRTTLANLTLPAIATKPQNTGKDDSP